MTVLAPILISSGIDSTTYYEACTMQPVAIDPEDYSNIYWMGALSRGLLNPDTNAIFGTLLAMGVYLTDYTELGAPGSSGGGGSVPPGCGPTKPAGGSAHFVDMDYINVILAGMQMGLETLGMFHVPEWGVADMCKPLLGLVGIPFIFIPQLDNFYHTYIWPVLKFTVGSLLMGGPFAVIGSSVANLGAINVLNGVENTFVNDALDLPMWEDVPFDFSVALEYLPGYGAEASLLHQLYNYLKY